MIYIRTLWCSLVCFIVLSELFSSLEWFCNLSITCWLCSCLCFFSSTGFKISSSCSLLWTSEKNHLRQIEEFRLSTEIVPTDDSICKISIPTLSWYFCLFVFLAFDTSFFSFLYFFICYALSFFLLVQIFSNVYAYELNFRADTGRETAGINK